MRRSERLDEAAENGSSTRKLRSKEAAKMDASLFNFEESPSLVDPKQVIRLVNNHRGGELFEKEELAGTINYPTNMIKVPPSDKRALRKKFVIKRILNVNLRLNDPLSEVVYKNYHRKMEKEEKRMANRDREKIHAEADRMRSQLETLQHNDWIRLLPTITYVRDTKDIEEMELKRQLTIDALKSLLLKYDDWKRRSDKLMGNSRTRSNSSSPAHKYDLSLYTELNKFDYIGESDTDEEEEGLTVSQIKERRKQRRSGKYGPIIKIKFGENVVIAEPFTATRIERAGK